MMAMRAKRRQAPSGLFSNLPELFSNAFNQARSRMAGSSNLRLSSVTKAASLPRALFLKARAWRRRKSQGGAQEA
jgi:hypothetical protein